MKHFLAPLALAAAASISTGVQAADALTDAMQAAYVPYRTALFRTSGKSQPEAQQAMTQTQQAWKAIVEQFGSRAPAPYDRDKTFADSLAKVAAVYDKAALQVRDNQLTAAHETLEAARDLMADLRRRNQVQVFSDHMNAYHAQMEHVLIDGPKLLAEAQGPARLLAWVGALDYLSQRLQAEAPAELTQNPEFVQGAKDVAASVAAMQAALVNADAAAARDAMAKLKQPYSKLFLKFG
jgi:hypothetical protein